MSRFSLALWQAALPIYPFLPYVLSLWCTATLVRVVNSPFMIVDAAIWIMLPFAFLIAAGALSWPHSAWIVAGRFPRKVSHEMYLRRKLYSACWTAVYYSPFYGLYFYNSRVRTLMLRLFGYRGSCDIDLYPDTWIRDLPLLTIGEGSYLANRSTLGTNMPLKDGTILVEGIRLGRGCMVGHSTILAAGVRLDDLASIGHGCALGVRVTVSAGGVVGDCCSIEHSVRIGKGVVVGPGSTIGAGSSIADGVHVPFGSLIARRTRIRSQSDCAKLVHALPLADASSSTRPHIVTTRELADELRSSR